MCQKNDLPLSLKSDTFNALCSDFDQILRSTLNGMEETEQDVAEINVKVKITLTPDSAPDFSVAGGQQTRSITKPKFDHSVSAVIQKKEKKTGTLSGNYELVWDRETCQYVMRPIDNGQTSLFDKEKDEVWEEPKNPAALPPSEAEPTQEGEVIDADYQVIDEDPPSQQKAVPQDAFEWLRKFAGQSMRVMESMGNYTVRTMENKVVLSSATSPDAVFYCSADKLKPHVGHEVVCTAYGEEGNPVNISVECIECNGRCSAWTPLRATRRPRMTPIPTRSPVGRVSPHDGRTHPGGQETGGRRIHPGGGGTRSRRPLPA